MSTVHAKLSPSKRHRWALCPGSIREEVRFPDDRSSPAAIDGTHSHTLLEHCIKAKLIDPKSLIGVKFTDDDGDFIVDADRAARVKVAIDYIIERVALDDGFTSLASEVKMDCRRLTGRDDLGGTVDVTIITSDIIEIIDYKDGMGIVQVEDNHQLEQYAIGALSMAGGDEYPWKEVRMTIIQPKLALKGMLPITSWVVPVNELISRVPLLIKQANATDAPDAPLVPGESQCKFCRAKGSCTALASNVMKEVGLMFQSSDKNILVDVAQQSADKDPSTMGNDQIRQIMEAAPLMRQLLDAVEKEAMRRIESGTPIEGLKLVHGRGSRSWALTDDEMAEKLVKLGIPKTAIYETKLVSPAKAEKLTWQKKDGTKASLTAKQLEKMEHEYIVKMAGKLTVVPESDSRPAIITNAAPLFGAVNAAPAAESLPSWLS